MIFDLVVLLVNFVREFTKSEISVTYVKKTFNVTDVELVENLDLMRLNGYIAIAIDSFYPLTMD